MPTRNAKKAKSKPSKARTAAKPSRKTKAAATTRKTKAAAKPAPKGRKREAAKTVRKALPRQIEPKPGRVDVVGRLPADIRVDPEITEGHPGYDETGPSEIIPTKRFRR